MKLNLKHVDGNVYAVVTKGFPRNTLVRVVNGKLLNYSGLPLNFDYQIINP